MAEPNNNLAPQVANLLGHDHQAINGAMITTRSRGECYKRRRPRPNVSS